MFYTDTPDKALRFGDIVKGLVLSATCVDKPDKEFRKDYQIEIEHPEFAVIISPCCSIGDKTLAISPLLKVLPSWFTNPYLREDLTRINLPMKPEQSVSPTVWQRLSQEEKEARFDMTKPESLAFYEYFIYSAHEWLPRYKVESTKLQVDEETGCYMIDFRKICRLTCDQVTSATSAPIEVKLLQLSKESRSQLRDKLSAYFARKPDEDSE